MLKLHRNGVAVLKEVDICTSTGHWLLRLAICSFYQAPTHSYNAYLDALKVGLSHLPQNSQIWVGGDISLPEVYLHNTK